MHDAIDLINIWSKGICAIHGTNTHACTAATEIATVGSTALAGATLGAAIGRGPGAVLGFVGGLLLGQWLNSLDAPTWR